MLAPPCFGPLRDESAAAITEYVSEPAEVTTLVVNVELFPPPCSIWRTSARSSTFASVSVYCLSGLSILRIFSAAERLSSGL